jgi:hypothetical protein
MRQEPDGRRTVGPPLLARPLKHEGNVPAVSPRVSRVFWPSAIRTARSVGITGCFLDAAAGQPPGHDAGLGLAEMPAGDPLGFWVLPSRV